jgi:phosphohistidine phosphatase
MKTLLLLRHAKSSWDEPGLDDHDRPLNKRGRKAAPRMGQLLRDEGLVPDAVLSSSALRARDTAGAVCEAIGNEGGVDERHDLYLAAPGTYLRAVRELPDEAERALVVGHNPGLEDLLEALCGRSHRMPTAALAVLELPVKHWSELELDGHARCLRVWRPKDLD